MPLPLSVYLRVWATPGRLAPSVGCRATTLQMAIVARAVSVPERLWEIAPSAGRHDLSPAPRWKSIPSGLNFAAFSGPGSGALRGSPVAGGQDRLADVAAQAVFLVGGQALGVEDVDRSEEHTSELQSRGHLVCRLLLEKQT